MSGLHASLPMYDMPELGPHWDALWALMRDGLIAAGMDAPERLDRSADGMTLWSSPDLLLSQTCGMPFRLHLHEIASIVGTPDFGLPGCPPGHYNSVLIARADDPRAALADFGGARFALNGWESQSGCHALHGAVASIKGLALGDALETGAHLASIAAIRAGQADVAAIDAQTWRIAGRRSGGTAGLKELGRTRPTPGLPLITARGRDAALIGNVVEAAISQLSHRDSDALDLRGFVRFRAADYTDSSRF